MALFHIMPPSLAQAQPSQSLVTKAPPSYDFEKRKRWADLLLTELVDNVPFILSSACRIWFCGVAVLEILGWRDTDLVDLNFIDLIEVTDQDRFRFAFEQAIENDAGFDISVRLKSYDGKPSLSYPNLPSKTVVFDIKCYTHVIPPHDENEVEHRCLIAMVSPYPSRNTAMSNTMLELNVQNDILNRKLGDHLARGQYKPPISATSPGSRGSPIYATSSLHATQIPSTSGSVATMSGNITTSNYQEHVEPFRGSFSEVLDNTVGSVTVEDQNDERSKKRKLKRSQNGEQYVCNKCGRTDSPEWRKGPLGPKTLCNACGLRWAKQTRRVNNPAAMVEDSLKANVTDASAAI